MANTPRTGMPEIVESQAGKYLTHNTALRILDGIVQATAIDKDLATPPVGPADGDLYIVAPGATDAWAGQDGLIAYFQSTYWIFIEPLEGWRVYVVDEGATYVCDGASEPGWMPYVDGAYEISCFFSGTPSAGQTILLYPMPRSARFAVDLAGSVARCRAVPDSATEFSIRVDDVEVATMSFESGSAVATFDTTDPSEFTVSSGSYLTIVTPDPADPAIGDIGLCLVGRRA